jgi:hypothetical protein
MDLVTSPIGIAIALAPKKQIAIDEPKDSSQTMSALRVNQ